MGILALAWLRFSLACCVVLINGLIIAFGKIPPFIVTLGMMTAARGIAAVVSGGRPIGDMPSVITWLGLNRVLGCTRCRIYLCDICFICLCVTG